MKAPAAQPPVWFPAWPDALQQLRLPPRRRQQYRLALIRYLQFCKQRQQQATVESARQFMQPTKEARQLGKRQMEHWKEALHWFFREGGKTQPVGTSRRLVRPENDLRATRRVAPTNTITDVPTLGATDLGTTD